jgi:hypothetical protein
MQKKKKKKKKKKRERFHKYIDCFDFPSLESTIRWAVVICCKCLNLVALLSVAIAMVSL